MPASLPKYLMNSTYRKGKDETQDIKVRLHFPLDITEEERAAITFHIKTRIVHEAKNAIDTIRRNRHRMDIGYTV